MVERELVCGSFVVIMSQGLCFEGENKCLFLGKTRFGKENEKENRELKKKNIDRSHKDFCGLKFGGGVVRGLNRRPSRGDKHASDGYVVCLFLVLRIRGQVYAFLFY